MCDILNKKPAGISEEEWEEYKKDLEEKKKARKIDKEYRQKTRGFDGDKYGLEKEEYIEYAEEILRHNEEGNPLPIKAGKMCNVHINCGCQINKETGLWETSFDRGLKAESTVCQICLTAKGIYNSNVKNMKRINNQVDFIYTIDPYVEEPIIYLGGIFGYDVNGTQVAMEILALDAMGKKKIKVYINSEGGSVKDGWSVFNAILTSKASVDTYNVGICASIAGIVFLAGKNRYMVDYGLFMMHNPYIDGAEDESENKYLINSRESLITMISERCKKSKDEVSKMMDEETWMAFEKCKEMGFATEEIKTAESNVKRMSAITDVKDRYALCGTIVNKIFPELTESKKEDIENSINNTIDINKNKKIDMNLNKINNKLGLNAEASEESAIEAINNLIDLKSTLDSSKEAYNKMQAELEEANNKVEELKNQIAQIEAINLKEKASEMVLNFAKIGKIKNEADVIEKWTKLAEGNIEVVKNLLEELPFAGKQAVTIQTAQINNSNEYDAVAKRMAEIQNDLRNKK